MFHLEFVASLKCVCIYIYVCIYMYNIITYIYNIWKILGERKVFTLSFPLTFQKLKSGYAAVSVNSPHCYQITMGRNEVGYHR